MTLMIINELLESQKMSRYRLSKESGVPLTTITDICSGKAELNKCAAGTLYKIAKLEMEIYKVRTNSNFLLNEIKVITLSEEKNRNIITELKIK